MFNDIYDEFAVKLLIAICILLVLRAVCQILCLPPQDKKEKARFHIFCASTPFEKFCVEKDSRFVDKKDALKITKEGYFISSVLALVAAVELAINFSCSFIVAVISSTALETIFAIVSMLKKPVLKLSNKILTKWNIV